jgi:hypothetical protein
VKSLAFLSSKAHTVERLEPRRTTKSEIRMSPRKRLAASAALITLALAASVAVADDHPYKEGPVVNISSIRTEYGKFDEYMAYLDTTWKKSQEAAMKAGYIVGYRVMVAEPRTPADPDIYLIITYKNWAALDGALAKGDEITKAIEGSLESANKAAVDRGKMRTVLGSQTVQEMLLK